MDSTWVDNKSTEVEHVDNTNNPLHPNPVINSEPRY